MWKALALVSVLALTPAPAALSQDADPEECVSLATIRGELAQKGLPSTEYTGEMAKNLIAGIVATFGAPPSDAYLLADPLVVVSIQDQVYLGFVVNGCFIGRAILPAEVWNEIVAHGRGA